MRNCFQLQYVKSAWKSSPLFLQQQQKSWQTINQLLFLDLSNCQTVIPKSGVSGEYRDSQLRSASLEKQLIKQLKWWKYLNANFDKLLEARYGIWTWEWTVGCGRVASNFFIFSWYLISNNKEISNVQKRRKCWNNYIDFRQSRLQKDYQR